MLGQALTASTWENTVTQWRRAVLRLKFFCASAHSLLGGQLRVSMFPGEGLQPFKMLGLQPAPKQVCCHRQFDFEMWSSVVV